MRLKSVELKWSYPVSYDNIFSSDKIYEKGIYYISRKFGDSETLLYIGKTNDCFYNRLYCHGDWLNQYRGKIFVRLGIIISPKIYDDEVIKDIESALIYEMKPLENTDKVRSYHYLSEYKIINTGYKGLLPLVISMREHV